MYQNTCEETAHPSQVSKSGMSQDLPGEQALWSAHLSRSNASAFFWLIVPKVALFII